VVAELPPPPPPPPYVQAALDRPRIPIYALGTLVLLPIWAFIYFGTLVPKPTELDPQLALGRDLYTSNCASCHGAEGQGGVGRPLDTVLLTFPNRADHLAWVHNGSPAPGTPYGDPNRPGGQRISGQGVASAMPAFKGSLTDEQIDAIVRYERETFGGEKPPAPGDTAGGSTTTAGK
jgi:mono/diheme cytochrome c family protein